jgi:hypothetical protein
VTKASLQQYHSEFGDDYFRFSTRSTQGFVLNTQFFEDAGECTANAEAQRTWFEACLSEPTTAVHRFVFGHIPPFILNADEGNGYFNLEPTLRNTLLSQAKAGGVTAWFAGHYHREAGGHDGTLEVITSSAAGSALTDTGLNPLEVESCGAAVVGLEKSGLRVVVVKADGIQHKFYLLGEVPSVVEV